MKKPENSNTKTFILVLLLIAIVVVIIVCVSLKVIPPNWANIADLSVLSACIISMKGK